MDRHEFESAENGEAVDPQEMDLDGVDDIDLFHDVDLIQRMGYYLPEVRPDFSFETASPTEMRLGMMIGFAVAEGQSHRMAAEDAGFFNMSLKEKLQHLEDQRERLRGAVDRARDLMSGDQIPLFEALLGVRTTIDFDVLKHVVQGWDEDTEDETIAKAVQRIRGKLQTLPDKWQMADMVRQLAPMLARELDFSRERQNLEHFAEMFSRRSQDVTIPRPINSLCTKRVLVMEELIGQPLAAFLREEQSRAKAITEAKSLSESAGAISEHVVDPETAEREAIKQHLSETIASVYLTMLFDEALFHADPHTANLIVLENGRLGILDFGMVGRIDENLRETIEEMLVAIATGDQNRLTRIIRRIGDAPPTLDESALAIDVAEYIGTFGRQSLGEFDLTGALNELSDILHRHAIKLPNQSALLLKMLISLEGTLRELGASFDSLEIVQGFMRRSMARHLSPRRRLRQARRIYLEAENFLEAAPDEVISLLRQARRGEVRMTLEHQRLGPTVNRLVLGLITSAVFLGSSLLLAMKVPPLLFPQETVLGIKELSLLGILGLIGSITVMMWLLLAINRSGHLTRGNED